MDDGALTGVGATDHFKVRPTALDTESQAATDQATSQQRTATAMTASPPASDAFGKVPSSSRFAEFNTTTVKGLADLVDEQTTAVKTVAQGVKDSAEGYRAADAQIAAEFQKLGQAAEAAKPQTVASTSWTPATGAFADQINANHAKIVQALAAERSNLATLQSVAGMDPAVGGIVAGQMGESQRKIALYEDILTNNRKFVVFDPAGQGRSVEMVGDIGADTRNVVVYTPGTHARLANEQDAYNVVNSFVQASPDRSVAGFVYQDGDFPQSIPSAARPSFSQEMAPRLADFTHQLDAQIAANAPGVPIKTTGIGWSYGSTVVSLADHAGARFDNEVFVEGAGMGHDIYQPSQLQPGVTRYSMTAPGDPIHYIQGVQAFGFGHGADPDEFPGNITLATGNAVDGTPIDSHDGWQQPFSDSWYNLNAVINGTPVTGTGDAR